MPTAPPRPAAPRLRRLVAVLGVVVALAGACASETGGGGEAATAIADNGFPSVEVIALDTGDTVDLSTVLGTSEQPLLLWFWAPH